MYITVCNFTSITSRDLEEVCDALNRRMADRPRGDLAARLRLQGSGPRRERQEPRSDAVIYLWDRIVDVPPALAEQNPRDGGLPFGFVIIEISEQLEEPWNVTLWREALALVKDLELASGVES